MSAATAGAKWLGSLFGDVMKPKVAGAAAAGGGLMFPSEDAEAAPVTAVIKNLPEFINRFNKMVDEGVGGRNEIAAGEKLMHDADLTNYDAMSDYATGHDGGPSGDFWKEQLTAFNDEIMNHGGLSNAAQQHWGRWYDSHMGRKFGSKGREGRRDGKYSKPPPQPKNNAMQMALAAAAAGGAGGANSAEMPLMGPVFASGFGAQEEGSSASMNGFEPFPVYDPTPVSQRNQDVMFAGPMGALGGSFSGGAKEYGIVGDGTMQAGQSLVRMIYEMMTGGGWDGAKEGAQQVINQGVDATQQQFGDYVTNKTGDSTLGFYAKWLPYAASPL